MPRRHPSHAGESGHELAGGLHRHVHGMSAENNAASVNRVPGSASLLGGTRPGGDPRPGGQCCDTWKQATSYCDTEFGLFEFWGCEPA